MRVLSTRSTASDLLPSMFDHMQHEVVVLDHDAKIVLVNEAFLRFGRENGLVDPETCLGQNYLHLCLSAGLGGDRTASRIGHALRELLTGTRTTFETTYPCHSPMEERWFRLTATTWASHEQHGALLVHEDMTFDRLAEAAIHRARGPPESRPARPRPFPLQPGLDALAQRIEGAKGHPVFVEGMEDLAVVADPEAWLESLARCLLGSEPTHGQAVMLSGRAQGRYVDVSLYGLAEISRVDGLEEMAKVVHGIRNTGPFLTVRMRAARRNKA